MEAWQCCLLSAHSPRGTRRLPAQAHSRGVDRALIPQGASVINFMRMLGGAIGVSLCGILLEWRLAAHGDSLTTLATSSARLDAFDEVFCVVAGICAVAIIAAWQLRERATPAPPSAD